MIFGRLNRMCAVAFFVLGCGVPGFADTYEQKTVTALYEQAATLMDLLISEASVMEAERKETAATRAQWFNTEVSYEPLENLSELRLTKARIIADQNKIHKIAQWQDILSTSLAVNLKKAADSYSLYYERSARDQASLHIAQMDRLCDQLSALNRVKYPILVKLAFSDGKEARPHHEELKAAVKDYNEKRAAIVERYSTIAPKAQTRRGTLSKHLWRFQNAFDALGLEQERRMIAEAQRLFTALPSRNGTGRLYWLQRDTMLITTRKCPSASLGSPPYSVPLKSTIYTLNDDISGPYEDFNEETNLIPRPPRIGKTELERLAIELSHRTLQNMRIGLALNENAEKLRALGEAANTRLVDLEYLGDAFLFFTSAEELFPTVTDQPKILAELERDLRQAEADVKTAQAAFDREAAAFEQSRLDVTDLRLVGDGTEYGYKRVESGGKSYGAWRSQYQQSLRGAQSRKETYEADLDSLLAVARTTRSGAIERQEKIQRTVKAISVLAQQIDSAKAHIAGLIEAAGQEPKEPNSLIRARQNLTDAKRAEREATYAIGDQTLDKSVRAARDAFYQSYTKRRDDLLSSLQEMESRYPFKRITNSSTPEDKAVQDVREALAPLREALQQAFRHGDNVVAEFSRLAPVVSNLLNKLSVSRQIALDALNDVIADRNILDRKRVDIADALMRVQRRTVITLQKEQHRAEIPQGVLGFLATYEKALKSVSGKLSQSAGQFEEFKNWSERVDSATGFFNISLGEKNTAMKEQIDGFVGHYLDTLAAVKSAEAKVDQAKKYISLYETLKRGNSISIDEKFKLMVQFLEVGEEAFAKVPVVGSLGGVYFSYMKEAVQEIGQTAIEIRDTQIQQSISSGLLWGPKRHLYTNEDVQKQAANGAISRWTRQSNTTILKPLQIERIIFLLGAKTINDACDKPLIKSTSEISGIVRPCQEQGALQ